MRQYIVLIGFLITDVFCSNLKAEEVIWRNTPLVTSQRAVPDVVVAGLGPSFIFADYALAQVLVECNPGQPRVGFPGVVNVISTFFEPDPNFQNSPDAFFNPITQRFEIQGQAILNVYQVTGPNVLPLPTDNPDSGIVVDAIFIDDQVNQRIEVRAEELLDFGIVVQDNVHYYIGLTPFFPLAGSQAFEGIHFTNEFPVGSETQSAVRQTAPIFEDWEFAGTIFGPPSNLFATIQLNGPGFFKLGDVNLDDAVNLLDVAFFIDAISTSQFQKEADINGDGFVNLLDVDGFITILAGS